MRLTYIHNGLVFLIIMSIFLFSHIIALAQDCGKITIKGKVTDSTGAAIPSANIELKPSSCKCKCCPDPNSCNCCVNQVAVTNEDGRFSIQNAVGKYILEVSVSGFKKTQVEVNFDEPGTKDIDIKVSDGVEK
jgi:hypothetical protein